MKILVIQLRRIGDILLTTPVLPYLQDACPGAEIDFLCEPMGKTILETNPFLHELLIYDKGHPIREIQRLRRKHYDVVLDFLNNPRTSFLSAVIGAKERVGFDSGPRSLFYNIRVPVPKAPEYVPLRKIRMVKHWLNVTGRVAPEEKSYRPELHLTSDDEAFAANWMRKEGVLLKSYAILAPAHRHEIRQWRPDGFRNVALNLAGKSGMKVFLAWGPGEEDLMKQIRKDVEDKIGLLPLTSLREMASIFKYAKLLVTNDSGAMHLAVSVRTPTVTVYGPTRPIDWNPSLSGKADRRQDIALTAVDVDCLGCHRSICPVGHICMTQMDEKRVTEACEMVLKEMV